MSGMRTDVHELVLPADHPGFHDTAYRARRQAIAAAAAGYRPGEPIPRVDYTDDEHAVWQTVSSELAGLHRRFACTAYRQGALALRLDANAVPQLGEVSARLRRLTGFRIEPVPGLVPVRDFYGALADRCFLSTQYVRHPSVPFYTPEPDVIHEVIGHANMLANPRFADLYQQAGLASRRARSNEALDFFSRVFWFTIEFGVVREDGEPRAYGAGILSSYAEIQSYGQAELRPFDLRAMGAIDYDITSLQPVLFEVASMGQLLTELGTFFDHYGEAAK